MMNENEIIPKIKSQLIEILNNTNLIQIDDISQDKNTSNLKTNVDIHLKVKMKTGKNFMLLIDVRSLGQPRYIRMAISHLKENISNQKNVYGIVGTSFLSEESQNLCKDSGLGFIDVAGNCYFQFNNIHIQIEGKPNPFPTTRPLKSIFSPKATRALRVLLCNPSKVWYLKDLAREAQISLGLMSNLKKRLLEYEWIDETDEGKIRLINLEALLAKWTNNYNYTNNTINSYYTLDDIGDFEERLISVFAKNSINYALTLTSGASRICPFLRYHRAYCYVDEIPDQAVNELNIKKVSSGANILFLKPYDNGVFYNLQIVNNANIVSDIQLYLDLVNYKERGEEAADFLYKERIRTQW